MEAGMHGFDLIEKRASSELSGDVFLYRHKKTGAELLSVCNNDENKVFGIVFRTPPSDSTGVAHILEHSVLCGSKKYPVKEPFVELLKGSLQTFLNAFTYPDKTCYPVASQNTRDFYNLIDVYLDAVFFPRITEEIFKQEGWHYEMETAAGPLTRKGVVFNEMKGVYSSPDSILMEQSQRSVFPDTTYGLDSGGDPEVIPELTYRQFQEFHGRYYHPSNARLYFYGDDDPEERLRIADAYLGLFDRLEPDSEIESQAAFADPVEKMVHFAAGDDNRRGMVTVNWLLPETTDTETVLALQILEQALLGMPASPLKRALVESGFGEDTAGIGLEDELKQMYFSVGMRGVDPGDFSKVEGLIMKTLQRLGEDGFPEDIIEAACNTIVFRMRENNTGRFPRGLEVMLRSLRTWLYGGSPFALTVFTETLNRVLEKIQSAPRYLEDLINDLLVGNRHRSTVRLVPDPVLGEKETAREAALLRGIYNGLTEGQRENIVSETKALLEMQQREDNPADLAKIPRVGTADLEKEGREIPVSATPCCSGEMLTHPLECGGILYLDLAFPLAGLSQEQLSLVPLFGKALFGMGTADRDYAELATWIGAATGGVHCSVYAAASAEGDVVQRLLIRGKALAEKKENLNAILKEALLNPSFDNRERFLQLLQEKRARMEHALIPSGHQAVLRRMRAVLHPSHTVEELFSGVSQLLFLRELEGRVKSDWPEVLGQLQELYSSVIQGRGAVINITSDDGVIADFRKEAALLMESLPVRNPGRQPRGVFPGGNSLLSIPAQVNYVGRGADLYAGGYTFHGSSLVISRFLRTAWLWEKVRVQGGAYGAFSPFNRFTGAIAFVSYRDPNCAETLNVYGQTGQYLKNLDLSAEDLEKAIVGAIGDIDAYMLPDEKGLVSMKRHLTGVDAVQRQRLRREVLGTTEKHFREFGELLERTVPAGVTVVLGPEELSGRLTEAGISMNVEKIL